MTLSRNVLNVILKHETLDEAERGVFIVSEEASVLLSSTWREQPTSPLVCLVHYSY